MVLKIIADCPPERPVYYAVTVSGENKIGLSPYLRMDGLAWRIMPQSVAQVGGHINPDKLKENLMDKYQYRNLDDPSVHYNTGIVKLLINARFAFLELARYYINQGQKEEALHVLDEMSRRIPEEQIPYTHEAIALRIAEHYQLAGRPDQYKRLREHLLPGVFISRREKLELVGNYLRVLQDWDRAESILMEMIEADPTDMEATYLLVQTYAWSKQYDKGIEVLEKLKMDVPDDASIQNLLNQIRQMAEEDTLADGATDSAVEGNN
jgi:tetratricopeptide (TPR) repeat protein